MRITAYYKPSEERGKKAHCYMEISNTVEVPLGMVYDLSVSAGAICKGTNAAGYLIYEKEVNNVTAKEMEAMATGTKN